MGNSSYRKMAARLEVEVVAAAVAAARLEVAKLIHMLQAIQVQSHLHNDNQKILDLLLKGSPQNNQGHLNRPHLQD